VALPLERETLKTQAQEVGAHLLRCERVLPRQSAQVLAFLLAAHAFVEHGHKNDQHREADARGRPCMHLVVQLFAQRIVGGESAPQGRFTGCVDGQIHEC